MYDELNREALRRFEKAARADSRVVAAFLGGSYATGTADGWSDLDLYLVATTAEAASALVAGESFISSWAIPVLHEEIRDFEGKGITMVLFILDDGVKGELAVTTPATFQSSHGGPHRVTTDKVGLLDGVTFPLLNRANAPVAVPPSSFWRQVRALGTDVARGNLWLAQGRLAVLRRALDRTASSHELNAASAAFAPLDGDLILTSAEFVAAKFEQATGASPLSRVVLRHLRHARSATAS